MHRGLQIAPPRGALLVLSIHRRFETLVALVVLAAVAAALLIDAEPASAQEPSFEAGAATAEGPGFDAEAAAPDPARPASRPAPRRRRASPTSAPAPSGSSSAPAAAPHSGFELTGPRARELLVKVVGVDTREVVRRFRLGHVGRGESGSG